MNLTLKKAKEIIEKYPRRAEFDINYCLKMFGESGSKYHQAQGFLEGYSYREKEVGELVEALEKSCNLFKHLNIQFGCAGTHMGIGTEECPIAQHHHHDDRCFSPYEALEKFNKGS